jgi:hypothetical protein
MNLDSASETATKARTPQRALVRSNESSTCLSDFQGAAPTARTEKASTSPGPLQLGDADVRAALRSRLARQLRHADTVLIEELGLC